MKPSLCGHGRPVQWVSHWQHFDGTCCDQPPRPKNRGAAQRLKVKP